MSKGKGIWMICLLILTLGIGGCGTGAQIETPVPTETTIKEATTAMASFSKPLEDFNTLADIFQATLGDMTSSEVDLDVYKERLGEQLKTAADIINEAQGMEIAPQYAEAQEMLVTAATMMDRSINDVLKYFSSEETRLLTIAKEEFNQARRAAYLSRTTLEKQAALDGYKK